METKTVSTVGRCQARGEPFYEGIQPPRPTHLHNTALPLPFAYNPDNLPRPPVGIGVPSCSAVTKLSRSADRKKAPRCATHARTSTPYRPGLLNTEKNVRRLSARQDEDSLISRGGGEGSSGPVSCLPVHTGAGLNHIEVYRFTRLSSIVVVQIRLLISRRRRRRCQNDDSLGASSERQQRKHAA